MRYFATHVLITPTSLNQKVTSRNHQSAYISFLQNNKSTGKQSYIDYFNHSSKAQKNRFYTLTNLAAIYCLQIHTMKIIIISFRSLVNSMSLFLLIDAQFDRTVLKQYSPCKGSCPLQAKSQLTQKQQINFQGEAKRLGQAISWMIQQSQISKEFSAILGSTLPNYKNVLSIKFNKRTHQLTTQIDILTSQQTFFKVINTRSVPQLTIKLNQQLSKQSIRCVQASFNPSTGRVRIQLPFFTGSFSYFNGMLVRGHSLVEYLYKNHVLINIPLLKFIVNSSCRQLQAQSINNLESTQRYIDLSHIRTQMTQSTSITEQQMNEMKRERKIDLDLANRNKIKITNQFFKLNQLFESRVHRHSCGIPSSYFQFGEEQEKSIFNKIIMPTQPKPKTSAENLLVLNYIYACNAGSLRLTKVDQGGFSSIFLTQITYLCVYPTPGYEKIRLSPAEIANHKDLLHKRVILKKEDDDCGFSRNNHELEIIKNIKEPSIFLPKYYIILNKPMPHKNAVIMDYVPNKNLNEYMSSNIESMTLRTKLYLIFSIIESLRFLRDQKIVHLDLKPNNIMIYYNLLVKLIDFGQSYHPTVCSKKQHKPGFTIPYSSPEIFSNQTKSFTSKSDVFSLGVIMFELLYRCFPYDIFEETYLIDDVMGNYLKKWLFVPEQFEMYGDIKILRILNLCISKCLSPVLSQRPELDWLAIIVRQCLDCLQ